MAVSILTKINISGTHPGTRLLERPLNTGKTLIVQRMDFPPWTTFNRIVSRYDGDYKVRTLRWAKEIPRNHHVRMDFGS